MTTLATLIAADVPVLLLGPPGTGKTACIRALAEREGYHLEVVIASAREPSDIAGLPVVTPEGVAFVAPAWARRLTAAADQGQPAMVFFDELTCAPPALQAPLLRLIAERRMDDWSLPAGCRIVAAANPPALAAGGWDLSAPAANRMAHVQWTLDPAQWAEWMVCQTDHAPERALVAAFVRARPALLLAVPPDDAARGGAWPSPRTWDYAARVAGDPEAVASLVGSGAASEYVAWRRHQDLPDPRDVLTGRAPLPERADALWATTMACAALAAAEPRWRKPCWAIIAGVADGHPDIAVPAARLLARAQGGVPDGLAALVPALQRVTA